VKKNYTKTGLNVIGKMFIGRRRIVHHKWVTTQNYPFVENKSTAVKWPNVKAGKVLPNEIRDALPIKTSKTARWVGIVNVPVGHRPQKFTQIDPHFKAPELRFFVDEGMNHTPYKVSASGAWPTQVQNFQEICDDVGEINVDQYIEAAKRRSSKIKLPKISEGIIPDEVLSVGTKRKSSSGFATSVFVGQKHGSTDHVTKPIAKQLFGEISDNYIVDRTLWSIGGRGRANKINLEVGDIVKSRVVLMPESVSKIIALAASNAWMRNIVKINKCTPTNEIGVGLDFMNGRYIDFSRKVGSYGIQGELDWKAFDTTVSEKMLLLAFAMIRACFPDDEKYDKIFYFQATGLIFKNVVVPGGFVYRITKSIPSGSPWTTALGCIVNWLAWAMIFDEIGVDTHVTCYGDDTVFGIDVTKILFHNFTTEWLSQRIADVTTLKAKDIKIWNKDLYPDPFTGPTLLKAYDNAGLPARTKEDFYSTLMFGGGSGLRQAKSYLDLHMKSRGALYNNPYNPELVDPLKRLLITTRTLWEKVVSPHPSLFNRSIVERDAERAYFVSKRVADNRFLQPENFYTPKTKIAVPWLDEQRYYCKYFVTNAQSLVLKKIYFESDDIVDGLIVHFGTKLVTEAFFESEINPKTGPPRKDISFMKAMNMFATDLVATKDIPNLETFLKELNKWAIIRGFKIG